MNGKVIGIYIAFEAGEPMHEVPKVMALKGIGLKDDRYSKGAGSFNKGLLGKRQVTLINLRFFKGAHFLFKDSRRNIITEGVELMWLIGKEFKIGEAIFKGVKYCDPCDRPNTLIKNPNSFKKDFEDGGGIIAEVVEGGMIYFGSKIIPPPKEY